MISLTTNKMTTIINCTTYTHTFVNAGTDERAPDDDNDDVDTVSARALGPREQVQQQNKCRPQISNLKPNSYLIHQDNFSHSPNHHSNYVIILRPCLSTSITQPVQQSANIGLHSQSIYMRRSPSTILPIEESQLINKSIV